MPPMSGKVNSQTSPKVPVLASFQVPGLASSQDPVPANLTLNWLVSSAGRLYGALGLISSSQDPTSLFLVYIG